MLTALLSLFPFVLFVMSPVVSYFVGYQRGVKENR